VSIDQVSDSFVIFLSENPADSNNPLDFCFEIIIVALQIRV